MNRSLIALALAGLAALPACAAAGGYMSHDANTSGAALLQNMECTRGARSSYSGGDLIVPADPVSYICYRNFGFSDGAATEQGPKMSESDYNIMLVKLDALRHDPRIVSAERQKVLLKTLATDDKARAEEAAKGIIRTRAEKQPDGSYATKPAGRTYAAQADLFAVPAMERNVAAAKKAVQLVMADPNASKAPRSFEGLSAECDSDIFRAKLELQQLDAILRKAAIKSFETRCSAKNKQRAEAEKSAENLAAEKAASVETPWQLEPVAPINKMDPPSLGVILQAMLDSGELTSVNVNQASGNPTYVLVIDNSPISKELCRKLVARGESLRIVVTSLYSGDDGFAAEMLTGGADFLNRWLSLPASYKSNFKAPADVLAKVKQNNAKLTAAKLSAVPFRLFTGEKKSAGFGLLDEKGSR